jgi:hypothetical protein
MKAARSIILLIFALAGVAYAMVALHGTPPPKDPGAISVILSLASLLFSWIVADYYANYQNERENRRLIDGVGERSSEKILNQSKQLWDVEEWAKSHAEEASDEQAETLLAIRAMIKIIRSSNNTYLGDWKSVLSKSVSDKMQEQIEAQDKKFKSIEQPFDVTGNAALAQNQEGDSLPSYLTPQAPLDLSKLTTLLEQTRKTNTEQKSQGTIRVRLNRQSYKFNFTGKLYPQLTKVPEDLRARMISGPPGAPSRIAVHAATGTTFDFHIHARSYEVNVTFPAGEYVFEYIIQVENPYARDFQEPIPVGTPAVVETKDAVGQEMADAKQPNSTSVQPAG